MSAPAAQGRICSMSPAISASISPARLEAACSRALFFGNVKYRAVKTILNQGVPLIGQGLFKTGLVVIPGKGRSHRFTHFLGQFNDSRQFGDVTFHTEYAVGNDQFAGILVFVHFKNKFEILHIIVLVFDGLSKRKPASIYN